jgi:(p)ppGpp synthase/HD superfamily hydrolase
VTLDPLRHVKFFAAVKHGDQKYAGGLPYTHHLAAVEAVLRRFPPFNFFEHGSHVLEAAWLHDVVEATDTKLKQIVEMFGEDVANLVRAVTNEPGENRKVRAALTYPKIRAAGPEAVALKLADRIANVEQGGSLVDMYRKEYEAFRRALRTEGQCMEMWNYLDNLMKEGI